MKALLPLLLALHLAGAAVLFSTQFNSSSSPLNTDQPNCMWALFEMPLSNYRADVGFIRQLKAATEVIVQYNKTLQASSPVCWLQMIQYAAMPSDSPFYLSKTEKIQLQASFSARSFDTEAHPYGSGAVSNANDDPRLAMMGVVLVNVKYGLTAAIFLTNEGIYAFQDSLGTLLLTGPITRLWTSARRVGSRNYDDIHSVIIEYDRYLNTLSWTVDGGTVSIWDDPGHPAFAVIEERVSDTQSVTLAPSELAHWSSFIWNGHMPAASWSNDSLGLADINDGSYVTPSDFVFKQPYSEDKIIYGATGVMTLYNFSIVTYPS